MADAQNGEIDAFITPQYFNKIAPVMNDLNQFINYTQINDLAGSTYNLSPRKVLCNVGVGKYGSGTNGLPSSEQLNAHSFPTQSSCIQMINTAQESNIGIGTNYSFSPLDYGECNINQVYTNKLNVGVGDVLFFDVAFSNLFDNLLAAYNSYALAVG